MVSAFFSEEEPVGPALSARLYRDQRQASRAASDRQITLRSSTNEPIDAMVENFSRNGFAMSTNADFAIGSVIGLSIGGALRRRVRIVRRSGLAYGCEFLSPLSELEVSAALRSGEVVKSNFRSNIDNNSGANAGRIASRKLSYLARAYIIGGLIISIWAVLIAAIWRLF